MPLTCENAEQALFGRILVAGVDRPRAVARGWLPGQCPRCPPESDPGNAHPTTVAFAWWPEPEVAGGARPVRTTACGCRWASCSSPERDEWVAAFVHRGVLTPWADRAVVARPPVDAGPCHRPACATSSRPPASRECRSDR